MSVTRHTASVLSRNMMLYRITDGATHHDLVVHMGRLFGRGLTHERYRVGLSLIQVLGVALRKKHRSKHLRHLTFAKLRHSVHALQANAYLHVPQIALKGVDGLKGRCARLPLQSQCNHLVRLLLPNTWLLAERHVNVCEILQERACEGAQSVLNNAGRVICLTCNQWPANRPFSTYPEKEHIWVLPVSRPSLRAAWRSCRTPTRVGSVTRTQPVSAGPQAECHWQWKVS